jgi:hypothetical protein
MPLQNLFMPSIESNFLLSHFRLPSPHQDGIHLYISDQEERESENLANPPLGLMQQLMTQRKKKGIKVSGRHGMPLQPSLDTPVSRSTPSHTYLSNLGDLSH